jgi:hypothetical protein
MPIVNLLESFNLVAFLQKEIEQILWCNQCLLIVFAPLQYSFLLVFVVLYDQLINSFLYDK